MTSSKFMYIISTRQNFENADNFERDENNQILFSVRYRDVTNSWYEVRSIDNLLEDVSDKNILVHLHGFNNPYDGLVETTYANLMKNSDEIISGDNKYDLVIAIAWPGGDGVLEFEQAKNSAYEMNTVLSDLILLLSSKTKSLDFVCHSLGCYLLLNALTNLHNDISSNRVIQNIWLVAAAMEYSVFQPSNQSGFLNDVLLTSDKCYIFFSKDDRVLQLGYPAQQFEIALGYSGPKDVNELENHTDRVSVVDCTEANINHGNYFSTKFFYEYVRDNR